ncbi:proteoglycan 4-like isoform X1 [Schistocerca americana]|uniref:proteoglycan 4-like isoform X1 n=1 Tax=Schistocerca americana TaxID=7009 RepID=UPI001F4FBDA4|nr:proteoglycan 4-like isoform X1 [Schistocerca americana]
MSATSWVTLATNDSYALGALVLGHSLQNVGTIHQLTVLVTHGVTKPMRAQLSTVFNNVKEVNVLDSQDKANLALLARPDLGITFTKLHCWRLTEFSKAVFLDADTLVLKNCDELFEREEFSAAPDAGWPDCFNSGVFVFKPSEETYQSLVQFAVTHGSFDGGDQGLLNSYFSDWSTKDISRHLPFIYNMVSSAFYSYLPALKQYGDKVKIVHFIGTCKPWMQYFDSETKRVKAPPNSEHLQPLLQLWWDIFCSRVHSGLSTDMKHRSSYVAPLTAHSTARTDVHPARVTADTNFASNFSNNQNSNLAETVYSSPNVSSYFTDPWEEHNETCHPEHSSDAKHVESQEHYNNSCIKSLPAFAPSVVEDKTISIVYETEKGDSSPESEITACSSVHLYCDKDSEVKNTDVINKALHDDNIYWQQNLESSEDRSTLLPVVVDCIIEDEVRHNCFHQSGTGSEDVSRTESTSEDKHLDGTQNSELSVPVIENKDSKQMSQFPNTTQALNFPNPLNTGQINEVHSDHNVDSSIESECDYINTGPAADRVQQITEAGLAGAFAQLTLGAPRTAAQIAYDEHVRRQAWEEGRFDYMGADAFDNIWQRISETLATKPESKEEEHQEVVPPAQQEQHGPTVPPETLSETSTVTPTAAVTSAQAPSVQFSLSAEMAAGSPLGATVPAVPGSPTPAIPTVPSVAEATPPPASPVLQAVIAPDNKELSTKEPLTTTPAKSPSVAMAPQPDLAPVQQVEELSPLTPTSPTAPTAEPVGPELLPSEAKQTILPTPAQPLAAKPPAEVSATQGSQFVPATVEPTVHPTEPQPTITQPQTAPPPVPPPTSPPVAPLPASVSGAPPQDKILSSTPPAASPMPTAPAPTPPEQVITKQPPMPAVEATPAVPTPPLTPPVPTAPAPPQQVIAQKPPAQVVGAAPTAGTQPPASPVPTSPTPLEQVMTEKLPEPVVGAAPTAGTQPTTSPVPKTPTPPEQVITQKSSAPVPEAVPEAAVPTEVPQLTEKSSVPAVPQTETTKSAPAPAVPVAVSPQTPVTPTPIQPSPVTSPPAAGAVPPSVPTEPVVGAHIPSPPIPPTTTVPSTPLPISAPTAAAEKPAELPPLASPPSSPIDTLTRPMSTALVSVPKIKQKAPTKTPEPPKPPIPMPAPESPSTVQPPSASPVVSPVTEQQIPKPATAAAAAAAATTTTTTTTTTATSATTTPELKGAKAEESPEKSEKKSGKQQTTTKQEKDSGNLEKLPTTQTAETDSKTTKKVKDTEQGTDSQAAHEKSTAKTTSKQAKQTKPKAPDAPTKSETAPVKPGDVATPTPAKPAAAPATESVSPEAEAAPSVTKPKTKAVKKIAKEGATKETTQQDSSSKTVSPPLSPTASLVPQSPDVGKTAPAKTSEKDQSAGKEAASAKVATPKPQAPAEKSPTVPVKESAGAEAAPPAATASTEQASPAPVPPKRKAAKAAASGEGASKPQPKPAKPTSKPKK